MGKAVRLFYAESFVFVPEIGLGEIDNEIVSSRSLMIPF
jgi:hypothetical protein